MKLTISTLAILMMTFFCNCKGKEDATASAVAETVDQVTTEQPEAEKLVVDLDYNPVETDPVKIMESSLEGEILTILVQYSGGCEDHAFRLVSNQRYMKSMPPQLPLYLEHQANGDFCRKLITRPLKFDISEAKYTGSPACRLLINGSREHEVVFEYGK